MLTRKQTKALLILEAKPGLTANGFAQYYFNGPEHEYLFTAVSNQGNGACAGKKAWRCAGGVLGRLVKQGLASSRFSMNGVRTYTVSEKGKRQLGESCPKGVCRQCGCTQHNACTNPEHGNCWWADDSETICSHCADPKIAGDPRTTHPEPGKNFFDIGV